MGERSADGSIKRATRLDYAQGGEVKRRSAVTGSLVIISFASSLLAIAAAWYRVSLFHTFVWPSGLMTDLGLGVVLAAAALLAGVVGLRRANVRQSKRAWFWAALAAVAFGVAALLFQMIDSYRE